MGGHAPVPNAPDRSAGLNGFVPLAYQLKAAGIDVLYPKCGIEKPHDHAEGEATNERFPVGPVNPMGQVKQYINAILASVNETDGWVGPGARPVVNGKKGDGNIYWGRSNAMFSLMQYAEAEKKTDPAEYTKVATVMKNYFLCQKKMMAITPLKFINKMRVDYACERLIKSHDTLSNIAFDCGFFDHSHFSKIFKKLKGMNPSDYRKKYFV